MSYNSIIILPKDRLCQLSNDPKAILIIEMIGPADSNYYKFVKNHSNKLSQKAFLARYFMENNSTAIY